MSQTTPMSSYSGPVVVDPLTRIEGHLRIEVEVEKGKVKDVRSCGTLFRGLEMILKGRDPRDVQHFTQRTPSLPPAPWKTPFSTPPTRTSRPTRPISATWSSASSSCTTTLCTSITCTPLTGLT